MGPLFQPLSETILVLLASSRNLLPWPSATASCSESNEPALFIYQMLFHHLPLRGGFQGVKGAEEEERVYVDGAWRGQGMSLERV